MKTETGTQEARYERFTWKPGDIVFGAPSTTAEAAQATTAEAAQAVAQVEEPELAALVAGLRARLEARPEGVTYERYGKTIVDDNDGDFVVAGIPKAARWVWGKMRAQAVRNARLEAEVKRLRALLREAGKGKTR